jgi:phage terminase large subunit-like protein
MALGEKGAVFVRYVGTVHRRTERRLPHDMKPQQYLCETLKSLMMVHIVTTVSAETNKCTRFQFVAPLCRAGLVLFALIWENC